MNAAKNSDNPLCSLKKKSIFSFFKLLQSFLRIIVIHVNDKYIYVHLAYIYIIHMYVLKS